MKKLYLILLMLLLLFIPTSINAVAVYQLDQPVKELNNHTLREVFEGKRFGYYQINDYTGDFPIVDIHYIPLNHQVYYRDISLVYGGQIQDFRISSGITYEIPLRSSIIIIINDAVTIYWYNAVSFSADLAYIEVDMTDLGIDNLSVRQMDTYYNLYLEAVRFEQENIQASQDIGGYQNIFRSIINGVKNLISEMGYVWQWLNAPIITSDMQDYSFNIDWSWDLVGVVRQILNSAGILTLQIIFWVPNLAFGVMGIPVQVSILSLLFSNLIFLLLGWIIVKSFII